ncbi:MAG TPA: GDP-mannose 4,6-dehydratase [bacterium]|nr:GDP-mannose 4,6-dehydratase [bacterium]
MKPTSRLLITGGAGFIGSHLAEALLDTGAAVTVLDDLSTGRRENIAGLLRHPRFRLVEGSILDEVLMDAEIRDCDEIYHLAAAVGVKLIFERPVRAIKINAGGTENVLEAACRWKRKVFLASTSEVYGKDARNESPGFRETDDIRFGVSMRWCYASAKILDEYQARARYQENGLPVVIGRYFNTVGPRQVGAYGMVMPRLVQQALEGRPLTVYGDGTQVRSFTWVGDAVKATVALMAHPGAVGEIYNIGSDEAVSVIELAERIKRATGTASKIEFVPYKEAYGEGFEDAHHRVPDISKLRTAIGYRPTRTLDEILSGVIAAFRAQDGEDPAAPGGTADSGESGGAGGRPARTAQAAEGAS